MEELEFLNYQKAPYLELDDYKAPKGINSYFVPMDDGVRIRVCHWLNESKECNGTIFLQQGHNEFIEKYYETIKNFLDKNFSVIAFWFSAPLMQICAIPRTLSNTDMLNTLLCCGRYPRPSLERR